MAAPVTVIIPTLNAADRIGPCLGALAEALFEGLIRQVILTDGGSTDAIAEIADEIGTELVTAPKGRGSQLRAGAKAAVGADWLLFLHADTVLGRDWAAVLRAHIAKHPDKAACFRLRFDSDSKAARWVAGWANLRSRVFGLPYGDQGLLISRRLYEQVGGYSDIPLMEDVAIARALGRRRIRVLACDALTSADRYERDGWTRRGWRNLAILGMYLLGKSPEALVKRYENR